MICSNCNKDSMISLDTSEPAVLFECLNCRYRQHNVGFQLTGIDASASLSFKENAILSGMIEQKNEND